MLRDRRKLLIILLAGGILVILTVGLLLSSIQDSTSPTTSELKGAGDDNPIQNPITDPSLTQTPPSPSPLNVPESGTILISGVTVQNFYANSQSIDSHGTILLQENSNFSILYFPNQEKFLVSITAAPFETYRQQAEAYLVATLNVPETEACRLSVEITTPAFANPEQAGNTFNLSFCD